MPNRTAPPHGGQQDTTAFLAAVKAKAEHRVDAGQVEEGIRAWRQYISQVKTIHGEGVLLAEALGEAGDSCVGAKRVEEGLRFYEQALKTTQKIVVEKGGEGGLVVAHSTSLGNLAFCYYIKGNSSYAHDAKMQHYSAAVNFFTRQISWLESVQNPPVDLLISVLTNHASLLTRYGAVLQNAAPWRDALACFHKARNLAGPENIASYNSISKKIRECESKMKSFTTLHAVLTIQRRIRGTLARLRVARVKVNVKKQQWVTRSSLSAVLGAVVVVSHVFRELYMDWKWSPEGLGHRTDVTTLHLLVYLPHVDSIKDDNAQISLEKDFLKISSTPAHRLPVEIVPSLSTATFNHLTKMLSVTATRCSSPRSGSGRLRKGSEFPTEGSDDFAKMLKNFSHGKGTRYTTIVEQGLYAWEGHRNPEGEKLFSAKVPKKFNVEVFLPELREEEEAHATLEVECGSSTLIVKLNGVTLHILTLPYPVNPPATTGSLIPEKCLLVLKAKVRLPDVTTIATNPIVDSVHFGRTPSFTQTRHSPVYHLDFSPEVVKKLFTADGEQVAKNVDPTDDAAEREIDEIIKAAELQAMDRVKVVAQEAERREKAAEKAEAEALQCKAYRHELKNRSLLIIQQYSRCKISLQTVFRKKISITSIASVLSMLCQHATDRKAAVSALCRIGRGMSSRVRIWKTKKIQIGVDKITADAELAVLREEEGNLREWARGREDDTGGVLQKIIEEREIAEKKWRETTQLERTGSASRALRIIEVGVEEEKKAEERLRSDNTHLIQRIAKGYATRLHLAKIFQNKKFHEMCVQMVVVSGLPLLEQVSREIYCCKLLQGTGRGYASRITMKNTVFERGQIVARREKYEKNLETQSKKLAEFNAAHRLGPTPTDEEHHAASKIQGVGRVRRAKKDVEVRRKRWREKISGVGIIQAFCRAGLSRVVVSETVVDLAVYVRVLQRVGRRWLARNVVTNGLKAIEDSKRELQTEREDAVAISQATSTIQRYERGRKARCIAREKRDSITQETHHAATIIQKTHRGVSVRHFINGIRPAITEETLKRGEITKKYHEDIQKSLFWLDWAVRTSEEYHAKRYEVVSQCQVVTTRLISMQIDERLKVYEEFKTGYDAVKQGKLMVEEVKERPEVENDEGTSRRHLFFTLFTVGFEAVSCREEVDRVGVGRERLKDREVVWRKEVEKLIFGKSKVQGEECRTRQGIEMAEAGERDECNVKIRNFSSKITETIQGVQKIMELEAADRSLISSQQRKNRIEMAAHSSTAVRAIYATERYSFKHEETTHRTLLHDLQNASRSRLHSEIHSLFDSAIIFETSTLCQHLEDHHSMTRLHVLKEEHRTWVELYDGMTKGLRVKIVYENSIETLESSERISRVATLQNEHAERGIFTAQHNQIRSVWVGAGRRRSMGDGVVKIQIEEAGRRRDVDGEQAVGALRIHDMEWGEKSVILYAADDESRRVFAEKQSILTERQRLHRRSIYLTAVKQLCVIFQDFEKALRTAVVTRQLRESIFAYKKFQSWVSATLDVAQIVRKIEKSEVEKYFEIVTQENESWRVANRQWIVLTELYERNEITTRLKISSKSVTEERDARRAVSIEEANGFELLRWSRLTGMKPIQKSDLMSKIRFVSDTAIPLPSSTWQAPRLAPHKAVSTLRQQPIRAEITHLKVEEQLLRDRILIEETTSWEHLLSKLTKLLDYETSPLPQPATSPELEALESVLRDELLTTWTYRFHLAITDYHMKIHYSAVLCAVDDEGVERGVISQNEHRKWTSGMIQFHKTSSAYKTRQIQVERDKKTLEDEEARHRTVVVWEEDNIFGEITTQQHGVGRKIIATLREESEGVERERALQGERLVKHRKKVENRNCLLPKLCVKKMTTSPSTPFSTKILRPVGHAATPVGIISTWWNHAVLEKLSTATTTMTDPTDLSHTARLDLAARYVAVPWGGPMLNSELTQIFRLYLDSIQYVVGPSSPHWSLVDKWTPSRQGYLATLGKISAAVVEASRDMRSWEYRVFVQQIGVVVGAVCEAVSGKSSGMRTMWNFVMKCQGGCGFVDFTVFTKSVEGYLVEKNCETLLFVAENWSTGSRTVSQPLFSRYQDVLGYNWTSLGPTDTSQTTPPHGVDFIGAADLLMATFLPLISSNLTEQSCSNQPPAPSTPGCVVLAMSHVPHPSPFHSVIDEISQIFTTTIQSHPPTPFITYYTGDCTHKSTYADQATLRITTDTASHALDAVPHFDLDPVTPIASAVTILTGGPHDISTLRQTPPSSITHRQAYQAAVKLREVGEPYALYAVAPAATALVDWARATVKAAVLSRRWDKKLLEAGPM